MVVFFLYVELRGDHILPAVRAPWEGLAVPSPGCEVVRGNV
jgi:hypothetical protein